MTGDNILSFSVLEKFVKFSNYRTFKKTKKSLNFPQQDIQKKLKNPLTFHNKTFKRTQTLGVQVVFGVIREQDLSSVLKDGFSVEPNLKPSEITYDGQFFSVKNPLIGVDFSAVRVNRKFVVFAVYNDFVAFSKRD
jgi:hypothetical protein